MFLRNIAAIVGAVLILAGCESDGGETTAANAPRTESSPAETPLDEASPLEGTWVTDPITKRDAERTLRQNALAKWTDRFGRLSPIADGTVLILEIGDQWDLYRKVKGGPREEVDYDASYSVDGNKLTVTHSAGSNDFRWSIDSDTLRLRWLRTSIPPSEGVPEEVFQRALYMTSVFERQN
jgi:hypothetical protein